MTGNAKLMVAAALTCFLTLSGCGDEWNCSNGKCRLERNATGCLTKETYRQLIDEFNYINDTGDTTRLGPLYSGGQCKRFRKGTIVYVMEGGIHTVKVRFVDSPSEPDRWMSAEALRSMI